MECNCNNNNNGGVIPWVRGNRLPLCICIYQMNVDQGTVSTMAYNTMTRTPYAIQADDTVTVTMKSGFRSVEMPFTTDGNKVLVIDNGELPTGTYTVEVTIERGSGERGRWQESRQVRIYENTDEAILGEMYSIEADLFFWAKGDTGNGIANITSNPDDTLTITMTDGTTYTTQAMKGDKGDKGDQGEKGTSIVSFDVTGQTETSVIYTVTFSDDTTEEVAVPKGPQGDTGLTGNGIASTTLNSDYTLTISYTDGTTYTTPSIRGAQGVQGVSIIAFTQTGETSTNTLYNVVFSDGRTQSVAIPKGLKGDKGDTGNTGSQGVQGPKGDTVTATDYTLYNVQGSDSQGAMSQDATTKAISAQTGYYTCGTAAGTAAKVVTVESGNLYKRTLGGHFKVKMTNANTASGVTLQVGSETAAPLLYNGEAVSASNTWEEGEVISVYYDGENYQASNSQGGRGKADKIKYDNSESGLASDNVQGALDEVKSNITYLDEIDISNNSILGGAIGTDGKWTKQSSSATNTHILIPVEVGERYRLIPNLEKTGDSAYAWLTSRSVSYDKAAPLVSGTSIVYFSEAVDITPPETALYLYVRTGWPNGEFRPSYFGIYKDIKEKLEEETTFSSGEKVSSKGIDNTLNGRSNNLPTSKAVFDGIKAVMSLESIDLTPSLNTDLKDCWFNSTGFTSDGKHQVIPVYGNYESVTITGCATDSRGSYYTFAKSYSTPSAGDPIDFCEGVSRLMVDANVTETIPIPSDCNYIIIGIINASNNSYAPKALSVEAYIATPPSNKKVEQALKPYANSAAWNDGSSWAVTTSPTYNITGGFIYKISAENCQVKIDARTGVASYYSFLKSFVEPKNGDSIDYVGEQNRITVAAGSSTGWIDIPSECNYVWIGIANTNNTICTPELVSFRYDVVDYVNGEINAVRDIAPYSYIGNSLDLRDFSLRKGFSAKAIRPNANIGVWGNNNDLAQQSLAIYNDFIFLFYHGGYCNVLDTNTCELLYSFQMNSDISSENNHCGNACFSEKFFASDDEFPLLYLSNHLNGGECYVLRIQRDDDGGFSTSSITLVQKINNAEGSAHNVAHFYPHKDKLICHSGTWYGIWNLPDINTETVETISIHSDDILEEFSTPISEHTAAGQVARNGRIFCLWYRDRGTSPRYDLLTIYNFVTNEYDAKIYLPGRLAASEFEGLDIYDGKIYIGYNKNNQIGIIDFGAVPSLSNSKVPSGSSNVINSLIDKNIQRIKNSTLNIIGDSVSNPSRSEYSLSTVWWGVMKDLLGFTVGTYSCISGTPVGGSGSDAFHNRVKSLTLNGGITIIAGGMNDLGADNIPLGTFNYGSSLASQINADATLTNSFIPAYRETIEWILTHNKNTRLYLCTITPRAIKKTGMTDAQLFFPWTNPTTNNNWVEFNDAIRKLAHDYGLGLIDFANIGMYQQNGFNDESGTLPADNIWTVDGVHPNVTYQKKMGELAANVIANTMF